MIIDDLITNRTQEDASYAAELAAKGQNMTEEEWAAYLAGLRGAYNYTDLNRVTEAMEYINDRLSGYGYTSGYKSIEISREQEPSGRLPKGYTELEYLESSGTQYIDTGFNANQDTQVVMDCTLLSNTTSAAAFFGARNEDASSAQQSFIAWSTGNGASIRSDYFGDNLSATYSLVGRRIVINKNKNVCTFDDKTVTNKTNTGQLALSLYLFGIHSGATANLRGAVMRLYSCKIYDNGQMIRDFVPCRSDSNILGLYDLVGKQMYPNNGSGSFIGGGEVQPVLFRDSELDPYTWYESDIPTVSQMDQYLANVAAIRSVLDMPDGTPNTPEDMEALTYEEANDIEQILVIVEEIMNRVVSGFRRSGQFAFWSGTLGLPCADSDFGRTWEELDKMEREWNDLENADWYLLAYGNLGVTK
nr:MAG TPA: hypothetical protein [Bacteriophage sp.]